MEQFATNEKTEAEDHGDEEDISEEYKDVDISDSLEDETSLEVHDEDTFQYNDVGNDMTGGMRCRFKQSQLHLWQWITN